jgi:hypothetical protein
LYSRPGRIFGGIEEKLVFDRAFLNYSKTRRSQNSALRYPRRFDKDSPFILLLLGIFLLFFCNLVGLTKGISELAFGRGNSPVLPLLDRSVCGQNLDSTRSLDGMKKKILDLAHWYSMPTVRQS